MATTPPEVDATAEELAPFDPLSPEYQTGYIPLYDRYRRLDPVNFGRPVDMKVPGTWYLFRYHDVAAALKDPRLIKERGRVFPETTPPLPPEVLPYLQIARNFMLFRDPPDHTRLRSLVSRAFTFRIVEDLRPRIEDIVNSLLDDVQGAGSMDLVADYATSIPLIVIGEMLGISSDDRRRFKGWSSALAAAVERFNPETLVPASRAGQELAAYLREIIQERRRAPRADLISNLIASEEQGGKLSEEEMVSTCILLLIAGMETTVNFIGNATLTLLEHPAELHKLRENPGLSGTAVEELLRFRSPGRLTPRWATEDMEIGGKVVKRGSPVGVLLDAANFDPAQFSDPLRFDITRDMGRHSSFGFGIHFCLGAPLARLEGEIALNTLLRRLPNLQLANTTPEWQHSISFRGLQKLPVTF